MAKRKASLTRDGTMKATAKEAMGYLFPQGKTQGSPYINATFQQTLVDEGILEEEDNSTASSSKKPSLQRNSTMAATAKEAKGLLGGSTLGDTRQETAKQMKASAKKPAMNRAATIARTIEEAKIVLDGTSVDLSEGRKTRSGCRKLPAKPAVKRAGTMQKTSKEGKSFVNRGKGKKEKGKK